MATRRERLEKFAKFDLANQLIEQANKASLCDSNCMKNRNSQGLKQKFDEAANNVISAPTNLNTARKNYYVYAFGQQKYDDFRENQVKTSVDTLAQKLTGNHNEFIKVITNNIDSYNTSVVYYKNMLDIFAKFDNDNKNIAVQIDDQLNTSNLNARRVNYEADEIERMNFYHFISLICYFFCFAIFVAIFLFMRLFTDKRNLIIFVVAILYPFFVPLSLPYFFKTETYVEENGTNFNVYLKGSTM